MPRLPLIRGSALPSAGDFDSLNSEIAVSPMSSTFTMTLLRSIAHLERPAMTSSYSVSTNRHPIKALGLFVFATVLAAVWSGVLRFADAQERPAFAPAMIDHMQQMRRFKDPDKGVQPTPTVIPRFGTGRDPSGEVATFQPNGATFTFNNAFF